MRRVSGNNQETHFKSALLGPTNPLCPRPVVVTYDKHLGPEDIKSVSVNFPERRKKAEGCKNGLGGDNLRFTMDKSVRR